jgi:hypothetical protein
VTSYSPTNPVLSSTDSAASFGTLSSWVNGVATVTVSYANNGSCNFVYTDGAISKTVWVTVTLPTTPVVTSVSPNSSTTDGGVTVTITGSQLTGTTGVTFGGISATNVTKPLAAVKINKFFAVIIATVFGMIVNFLGQKIWVFKQSSNQD